MSLQACADLVHSADPDRAAVTIYAPEDIQKILWPLYAFNVEVSRAPWVTQEPMIAEIRLQWWRDALEEIREAKPVRSHEVTEPLAAILDAEGAMSLDKLVDARKWDIYSDPFADMAEFESYIDATYGNLLWTAARLIDPDADEKFVRRFAYACGVAALLRATASLKTLKRNPVPDDNVEAFLKLGQAASRALSEAAQKRATHSKLLTPLLLSGWAARPTLQAIQKDADSVYTHGFTQSEFSKRWRVLKVTTLGWWH